VVVKPLTITRRKVPMASQYEATQYVGIDLHRRRSVIVRKDADGEVPPRLSRGPWKLSWGILHSERLM
jgi:hypothetical protein